MILSQGYSFLFFAVFDVVVSYVVTANPVVFADLRMRMLVLGTTLFITISSECGNKGVNEGNIRRGG